MSEPFPLRLPSGTQVVTRVEVLDDAGRLLRRAGTVGVVVDVVDDGPEKQYRIRFASGGDAVLLRGDLSIRKERQREVVSGRLLDAKDIDRLLTDQLVYRCVVGSRA
jgi:hypothetical protein